MTPGLTDTPAPQTFHLDDTTTLGECTGDVDPALSQDAAAITGATIESGSLVFPAAACSSRGSGTGSGLLRWSDGSVSAFTVAASPPSEYRPAPAGSTSVRLVVGAGRFYDARAVLDITFDATQGECASGVTAMSLTADTTEVWSR